MHVFCESCMGYTVSLSSYQTYLLTVNYVLSVCLFVRYFQLKKEIVAFWNLYLAMLAWSIGKL